MMLMTNFLLASLDARKHTIGILRAMGARRRDVVHVCLAESLLMALIDFLITLLAVGIACAAFNAQYYGVPILQMGFLPLLLTATLCFGTAALASALPALHVLRQRPIDIISKNA